MLKDGQKNSQEDILRLLLEKGADVNIKDSSGQTPLHLMECLINPKYVELCLPKIKNINETDNNGQTPLHSLLKHAEQYFQTATFRLLLEKGADVNIKDKNGQTPLHLLLKYVQNDVREEALDLLLEKGADVNIKDNNEETPLHILATKKRIIKSLHTFLINNGADFTLKNKEGKTPLDIALDNKNMGFLFNTINQKDKNGRTPLLAAIEANDTKKALFIMQYNNFIDFSLSENNKEKLAKLAHRNGNVEIVTALKERLSVSLPPDIERFLAEKSADVPNPYNFYDNQTNLSLINNRYYSEVKLDEGLTLTMPGTPLDLAGSKPTKRKENNWVKKRSKEKNIKKHGPKI